LGALNVQGMLSCPDEFDQAMRALDDEMRQQWEQKWQGRL
jgi:hypothetical protein